MSSFGADRSSGVRLDVLAAFGGLLVALALFPLRFLASQIYILTIPLVLGLACALYLIAVYRPREATAPPLLPTTVARSLPGLSFAAMGLLVVVATVEGGRTLPFYLVAAVVASALTVQPLAASDEDFRPRLTLVQVVLFAAVLRFTALATTPGFIGIDIWSHVPILADRVATQHSLSAMAGNKYYASPLYHLLVAAASFLYDVPLRAALYLSLGVAMPISVVFVYLTTGLLVRQRWAVLAASLYAVGDYTVQWGMHLIPTSMGLAFYLAVLYALVRVMRTEYGSRDFLLLVFLTVVVILTHQVSSFIMLVTLLTAIVAQVLGSLGVFDPTRPLRFTKRETVNVVGLFVFDAGFVTFMWSLTPYNGNSFLETVFSYLEETVRTSAGFLNLASGSSGSAGGPETTLIEQVALYVDTLGFLFLLFATFVGCLYVVSRDHARQSVLTLLVSAAVMLVFVMLLPMFGIRNFIPTRWFAFLYAPMAVLAAVGFRHLSRDLAKPLLAAVLLLFVAVYPGAMILSGEATVDNPVFEDDREELAYTESEITAAHTIGDMTGRPRGQEIRPNQVIFTDHPYQTVIDRIDSHPTDVAVLNESQRSEHDITVYRRAQSTEATFFLVAGNGHALNVPRERVCRPNQNVLYANGDVALCTAPS
ncbi:hypothetical protein [Halosimplex salinum]|uniref:hypothetical protein n=1 Tax=Halosimplex salinum TaxID=1710538 RepID=UPI000F491A58|nr:hypothetical protein [Halosimplex salinum]